MTILVCLMCAPLAAISWYVAARRGVLVRHQPHVALYALTVVCEHAAAAGQMLAAWYLCRALLAPSAALIVTTVLDSALMALVILDGVLFAECGMRLQRSLMGFVGALTEFGNNRPWRRQLLLLAGMAVTWVCALALTLQRTSAAVSLWVGAVTVAAWALTAALRRRLPALYTYAWNNRLVAWERTALLVAWRLVRSRSAAQGIPPVLLAQQEISEPVDMAYPLLRRNTRFHGAKHFELRLADGERPHVVFLFLESVRAADVGVLGAKHRTSVTPHFDRLAQEGVLWNNFYANGTITSRAMTAALYGVLPDFEAYSMQMSEDPPPVTGMPQLFAQRGYFPAYFCDGPMDWENKRDYFLRHGFATFHGAPSITNVYPDAPYSPWNFPDEYLMRFHADWLVEQDAAGVPTFSSVLTVTNHTPWFAPDDAPTPDVDVDPNSDYGRYLRTTQYTDQCLGMYMDLLREKGLAEKTIVFVLGDHGQQVEPDNRVGWSGAYADGSVRVPLLLWAPGRVQPKVIDETASQVDLLPTVMDLLAMDGPHHGMGTSLVRRCKTRQAYTIHPWSPGMLSNRVGPYRFVYSFDEGVAALYDTHQDPEERHDLAAQHPLMVHEQTELAWALRHAVNALHGEKRFAPPALCPPPVWPRAGRPQGFAFPLTNDECDARARYLTTAVRTGRHTPEDLLEFGVYLQAALLENVTPGDALLYTQLLMARVRVRVMGELTRDEMRHLVALDGGVLNQLATSRLPPWAKMLTMKARRLAGLDTTPIAQARWYR